jgi:hypothetical protein
MKLQALMIRAGLAAATSVMVSAAVLLEQAPAPAPAMLAVPATTTARHAARQNWVAAPVVLPVVHVRPTRADATTVNAPRANEHRFVVQVTVPVDSSATTEPAIHGMTADMPYYSFGKVLSRMSKE